MTHEKQHRYERGHPFAGMSTSVGNHLQISPAGEQMSTSVGPGAGVPPPGFADKPLKPGAVVLYTVRGVDGALVRVEPEDFPPLPNAAHRFDYIDLFTRNQMWEYILAERHRPAAQPANTDDASGSPSGYLARPSDPDLNPVSVKDLSASASPATKEQQ